jgi:hypothetical protein
MGDEDYEFGAFHQEMLRGCASKACSLDQIIFLPQR